MARMLHNDLFAGLGEFLNGAYYIPTPVVRVVRSKTFIRLLHIVMSNPGTEILNPFTPLAFLDPTLASQFEVSRYLYAATLGGYIWDIAINLENDYRLLFKHKIRYPTVVYYLSRVLTLAYILTSFAFQATDVSNCNALQLALGICNVLTQTFTSFLFFLRVTAVWHGNRYVFFFFTVLWLGVIAGAITVPVGIRGAHIGPTQQCINIRVPDYAQLSAIMPLIFDSCTFIAITYRILLYSSVEGTARGRLRAFFGKGVPIVSRNLLLGGQHYYLVAVCGNVVVLVLIRVPGVPAVYRAMCTIPILAVINAMACIVFRKIKFGLITPDGTVMAQDTSTFHAASGGPPSSSRRHRTIPLHYRPSHTDNGSATLGAEYEEGKSVGTGLPLEVRMMQETARFNDNDFPVKSTPL
ncbi:hypothetical protein IW261DRAFT_768731 [Armillaria novae-zelandiae]|uniref:Uncharacterized protein n=1 Tax=Armillaria novae-zelandiae TaxID=153914 RepID=A0AA39TFK7_9AGAR|nr:hypothetical protein IW261DRAFT_768731 [Armillaria novae-zelandiae]